LASSIIALKLAALTAGVAGAAIQGVALIPHISSSAATSDANIREYEEPPIAVTLHTDTLRPR
jgi:hypothetical protein